MSKTRTFVLNGNPSLTEITGSVEELLHYEELNTRHVEIEDHSTVYAGMDDAIAIELRKSGKTLTVTFDQSNWLDSDWLIRMNAASGGAGCFLPMFVGARIAQSKESALEDKILRPLEARYALKKAG